MHEHGSPVLTTMSNVKHFQGQEEMENACSTGRASCVTRDTEPETDGKLGWCVCLIIRKEP